jgi:hypothetical protein
MVAPCLWRKGQWRWIMQLSVFRRLSPKKQHQLVATMGSLLCERKTKNFLIYLYQLDGFYIELFFFKESGEFATMKPFDNLDELAPYLEVIDLTYLLN